MSFFLRAVDAADRVEIVPKSTVDRVIGISAARDLPSGQIKMALITYNSAFILGLIGDYPIQKEITADDVIKVNVDRFQQSLFELGAKEGNQAQIEGKLDEMLIAYGWEVASNLIGHVAPQNGFLIFTERDTGRRNCITRKQIQTIAPEVLTMKTNDSWLCEVDALVCPANFWLEHIFDQSQARGISLRKLKLR